MTRAASVLTLLLSLFLVTGCAATPTPPAPIQIGTTEARCKEREGVWTPVIAESGIRLGYACTGGTR